MRAAHYAPVAVTAHASSQASPGSSPTLAIGNRNLSENYGRPTYYECESKSETPPLKGWEANLSRYGKAPALSPTSRAE